jgi:hypothetical protein
VFTWAVGEKLLTTNPFKEVRISIPRETTERETKAFTADEAQTVLRAAMAYQNPRTVDERARRWVPWLIVTTTYPIPLSWKSQGPRVRQLPTSLSMHHSRTLGAPQRAQRQRRSPGHLADRYPRKPGAREKPYARIKTKDAFENANAAFLAELLAVCSDAYRGGCAR